MIARTHMAERIAQSSAAPDERDLVLRIKAGDEAALASMMERYSSRVYAAAFRVLKHRPDAQEVTQDVFLALWRRPEKFDAERGRLGTWLVILSRSRALDLLRAKQTEQTSVEADSKDFGDRGPAGASETKILVEQLVGVLPQEQAWVLKKVYIEGYTVSEAAALRRTKLGTMKGRARLALEKLRSALVAEDLASRS